MRKISIISEQPLNIFNGNTVRPQWEYQGLKKNGLENIELVGNFTKQKEKEIQGNLIHAQQLSGRLLENSKFISDVHGLEYFQSENLARGFPIYSWKKWAFLYKSKYWKKIERETFEKSLHLICAGESIFERVKKIQSATVVRNSLILDNFSPTSCNELNIALVGPFIPGKINYLALDVMKSICKKLSNIKFTIIGKTDSFFRENLNFKNVEFVGETEHYIDTLRKCSVLFSPYPEYAYYLGSKNKILEAAACEMPIVTTKRGTIDFNKDLLVVGDTVDELIEGITYLKNENIRKKMGKKLRNEIERNHNADIESKKLIKIYNEFV